MKGQTVKPQQYLHTTRLIINYLTPALCGIVLVEICFQIIWSFFVKNNFTNEIIAVALVGCLLYATIQGIMGDNSRVSTIVSGLFYCLGGLISSFIQHFDIILFGMHMTMSTWAMVLMIIGAFFIFCGINGK